MSKKSRNNRAAAEVVSPETPATPSTTPETPSTPSTPATGKNGRLRAHGLPCLCGCGDPTRVSGARFLPGHDAKLRAAIRKAHLAWDAIPEIARPFFEDDQRHGEATAGLMLVAGEHGHPILRDVKAERRSPIGVADDAREMAMAAEIASLKAALETAKRTA